ncbi:MAG TPA: NADPH-dependent assimilatory sulfite reductase hemoprotein subunit [Candidatus Limnocylindrales bacterium]|nr:NADPH-dependent assimilatory sulfite reductase hemoprotein subunit [Candidatus Limnocylindrales bacterium]
MSLFMHALSTQGGPAGTGEWRRDGVGDADESPPEHCESAPPEHSESSPPARSESSPPELRESSPPERSESSLPEHDGVALAPLANKSSPSSAEAAKAASRHLRAHLAEALVDASPKMEEDEVQVLKFHGAYQQDDRDWREAAKSTGGERAYSFMVRVKVPGGMLSAAQYLAMDRLADEVVRGRSLRVTTRQNFQLHGVLKTDLVRTIRVVNECLLTTLSGCGDVERNIVAPPAPLADAAHASLRALAGELTAALAPSTNAYHEIWLGAQKVDSSEEPADPLYGETYLPRKFKTGLALPDDDAVEVLDQDCALIGLVARDRLYGFNIALGGGGGLTHRKPDSYARLATPLGSIDAEHVVEAVRIVAGIFRDFGDRTDRKHARLKHVVEERGIDAVRAEFCRRAAFPLRPWVKLPPLQRKLWLGRHEQGDGRVFIGVALSAGRIADTPALRLKTALAAAVRAVMPNIVLTPQQNILFTDMTPQDADRLESVLHAYRIETGAGLTPLRQQALACPALPTCGLALAEAERVAPDVLDELERELMRLGRARAPLDLRITGCANGCVRTYNAEIGLVGRKPGHYDIYVGGGPEHLAEIYAEVVSQEAVVLWLRPLLECWASESLQDEGLGSFYRRRFGSSRRADLCTGAKDDPAWKRVAASSRDEPVMAAHSR